MTDSEYRSARISIKKITRLALLGRCILKYLGDKGELQLVFYDMSKSTRRSLYDVFAINAFMGTLWNYFRGKVIDIKETNGGERDLKRVFLVVKH